MFMSTLAAVHCTVNMVDNYTCDQLSTLVI